MTFSRILLAILTLCTTLALFVGALFATANLITAFTIPMFGMLIVCLLMVAGFGYINYLDLQRFLKDKV